MPYGVRKFPNSADPRAADFAIVGFAFGAVPAIKYRLRTTGASGLYLPFNGGQVIGVDMISPNYNTWEHAASMSFPVNISLAIFGYRDLQPGSPPYSVAWTLSIIGVGDFAYIGNASAAFPNAITGWPTIPMTYSGVGPSEIPNPITLEPCIWDTPIAP